MSNFITSAGNPPLSVGIQQNDELNATWANFVSSLSTKVNDPDFYGKPSALLNSDFNWNTGVSSSTTQADGNGATFSEKWQVQGAGVASYTLTPTLYAPTNPDNIGSRYYVRVQVTSYSSGSFYFYQRQTGNQFVRRYQDRPITLSAKITNDGNANVEMQFEYFLHLNPSNQTTSGKRFIVNSGLNEISDTLQIAANSGAIFGAGAYSEFRLKILNINATATDLKLQYIKCELADSVSILYVDHALERSRIDNT